ncbi:MAG: cation diffusion facilitator family transporter [Clostridium sp.]|nr:cation diffusion facilitator family transporter [Acetatifactor muris]MCM1525972.1 cation diffusion facilitator family transporter [Bacteroides sp.]MCM1562268.1 cation diffusion facilitator family transporter [Clostridium sp.]
MITILAKLFIKNKDNTEDPRVRQGYGILCGAIGIALNLMLFAGKALAGALSGSIAITADAFNNLSDAGSSIVTLLGFKLAGQKPDSDHPFGHGRLEYISGLVVAFLILLMAFELFQTSVGKILHPERPEFSALTAAILLISIAVKCYMALYNRNIGRRIGSVSMGATATDSLGDVLATSIVLISLLLCHYTGFVADGYCGVIVAVFICIAGINAAKDTINPLLGQAPDPEFVEQVNSLVLSHEGIIGIHDLMVHNYGPGRLHLSLHAEVPADGDILEMHDLIDLIEHELRAGLHCSAVIHMDPVCVNDPETDRLHDLVLHVLSEIDPDITMHDFRIVKGPTHTNLIFDVVVPFDYRLSDNALTEIISYKLKSLDSGYYAVIDVDKK